MANEDVQLTAKLSLDTTDAERKLSSIGKDVKSSKVQVELPKDTAIQLPKDATDSLNNVFKGPKGLLGISRILTGATRGINGLLGSIQGVVQQLTDPKVGGVIALIIALVSMLVKLVAQTDTYEKLSKAFKEVMNSLSEAMKPLISTIGEEILPLINSLATLLEPFVGILSSIVAVVQAPVVFLANLLGKILDLISELLRPISDLFSIFSDISISVVSSLVDLLDEFFSIFEPFIDLIHLLSEAIVLAAKSIKSFLSVISFGLIDFDKSYSTTGGSKASGYTSSLDVWETSTTDALASASESLDDSASTWEELGEKFTQWFSNLSDLWDNFVKMAAKAWDDIVNIATLSWNAIWSVLSSAFSNLFNDIVSFFSNMFSSFTSTVKGFGGGLFTSEGRWGDGYQFGDIAGSVWDFLTGLVGKGWLWADGGTLDLGAQIWGMNEKGNPEFMFNAGGHDTVINKDILSDAMYQALVKANNRGVNSIEVSVKPGTPSGPKELVQMILPSLKFALK